MRTCRFLVVTLVLGLGCSGCAMYKRQSVESARIAKLESECTTRDLALPPELEDRILALDPTQVQEADVREVLARAPAPQIVKVHGGIHPVQMRMVSFSEFLVGMGYPEASVRHPSDGTYSFSCYESSDKIAGVMAWYYERQGLRPMLMGHSQGGFTVVKVLHKFSGNPKRRLHVWNPITWKKENRSTILDPLTRKRRPVATLSVCYAASVGAGGLTRIFPNQWDTLATLRKIPDSVDEFTGYYQHGDLLGGDLLGHGPMNRYYATGKASVRNIRLPNEYKHGAIPTTDHLLASQDIKDWINAYQPMEHPRLDREFAAESKHILWAADVWYSIKRHWVQELQTWIRARRALRDQNAGHG